MPFPNHREGFQASDQSIFNGFDSNTGCEIYRLIGAFSESHLSQNPCAIGGVLRRSKPLAGEIEIDESYFGPKRVRGKRGRGAGHKTIVFGVFKRGEHVYTQIVPDARKTTLLKAIRGKVDVQSIIHSDGWPGYDGLVDVGYAKHLRVNHGEDEFANDRSHINGIESFWAYAKHRLTKFKGVPKHTFYLHLKETEFRFNHRSDNLYLAVLKLLRENPI